MAEDFENPIAEAEFYYQLMTEQFLTVDEVAQRRGVEREMVYGSILLLNLPPEVREYVRMGLMERELGCILLRIEHMDDQIELGYRCIKENMNAAQLEQAVQKRLAEYN